MSDDKSALKIVVSEEVANYLIAEKDAEGISKVRLDFSVLEVPVPLEDRLDAMCSEILDFDPQEVEDWVDDIKPFSDEESLGLTRIFEQLKTGFALKPNDIASLFRKAGEEGLIMSQLFADNQAIPGVFVGELFDCFYTYLSVVNSLMPQGFWERTIELQNLEFMFSTLIMSDDNFNLDSLEDDSKLFELAYESGSTRYDLLNQFKEAVDGLEEVNAELERNNSANLMVLGRAFQSVFAQMATNIIVAVEHDIEAANRKVSPRAATIHYLKT